MRARTGMASEVAIRVLIQTGRALGELTDADFDEFGQAIWPAVAALDRLLGGCRAAASGGWRP